MFLLLLGLYQQSNFENFSFNYDLSKESAVHYHNSKSSVLTHLSIPILNSSLQICSSLFVAKWNPRTHHVSSFESPYFILSAPVDQGLFVERFHQTWGGLILNEFLGCSFGVGFILIGRPAGWTTPCTSTFLTCPCQKLGLYFQCCFMCLFDLEEYSFECCSPCLLWHFQL